MVRAIQRGDFAPDLPRAERVARALSEEPDRFKHLPVADDLPDDDPVDENVSEDGSDVSDVGELFNPAVPAPPEEVRPRVACPLQGQAFIHVLSGISHVLAGGDLGPDEPQLSICQQCASAA